MPRLFRLLSACIAVSAASWTHSVCLSAEPSLELKAGDHVCIIGNTLADRMQHHGWLETMLQSRFAEYKLVFRNLGFPGDEIKTRPRSQNFGSPDQWLTKTQADVIFCFFGYNESRRGEAGLPQFERDLADMIAGMKEQKYNGESPPRIVVVSPVAHEDLQDPNLPDGKQSNKYLELYTAAMAKVCRAQGVLFVDVFHPTKQLYETSEPPLTMNGVHLLDRGNRALAEIIDKALFGERTGWAESQLQRLREAIQQRNLYWFSRYRVVDGYNVYGGRSKLAWHGQSNADVMRREMEIFDIMTANRDKRVWAVAQGNDLQVVDDNIPALLEVKTNKPGPLEDGGYPYIDGQEAIDKMSIHKGMKVNLFASEKMFPEIANPVQMAVDTDSRLWVSCWPSYPHWNPTKPREDKLVILPDDDGDGVADRCVVFADNLNSITGFEFWGGGVIVSAPPELWFLKDTDGDDRADYRLRILQGISSADTHHTANAMLIGPDGWLYWSRGVFHVTNMETPTKTFRSTTSGVYRFNPRTFEVEFHFPIGPNPHGHVFDRWGYEFANDGTSGTGSYVNIGKGIGNKHWFKKRVRPVPATGILSSSHFPQRFEGNFLICNAIGFLGVLQHEVKYNGADITAEEIDPILVSSDPNFRPSDLEIGGDGALYVADWHNALIGHMQHNIRDPNRDNKHGRVYRVTYEGRPLLKPVKMKGKPITEVCENFFALENGTRYRARLELSGRETKDVVDQVGDWAARLDPSKAPRERDEAQALLECLWVFEEHRVPNLPLVQKVVQAEEPRVRAAAIRTLGHWAGRVDRWEQTLLAASRDQSALVRAEALKAAVEFQGPVAAEVLFEVAARQVDPELETVLKYARGRIDVDKALRELVSQGKPLSVVAQQYALRNASAADLMKVKPSEAVYLAILSRSGANAEQLEYAVTGLAKIRNVSELKLLLNLVAEQDKAGQTEVIAGATGLLLGQPVETLRSVRDQLQDFAMEGETAAVRRLGFAAWIVADGSGIDAIGSARAKPEHLADALAAISLVTDGKLRSELFPLVRPLLFESSAGASGQSGSGGATGLKVEYFQPNPSDVALATLQKRKPQAAGIAKDVSLKTDVISKRDGFALRFSGAIRIDKAGQYTFHLSSDDGSRLYLGGKEVINNDGLHGVAEKSGKVQLRAGMHPIVVTYFDNGGGDGLSLAWSGPGIGGKKPIPADRFSTAGGSSVRELAIAALQSIPGFETEKFRDLARLVREGQSRDSALGVLRSIDQQHWDRKEVRPLVDGLVAYLSNMPAKQRTGKAATEAIAFTKSLTAALPGDQAVAVQQRLKNLDVRVIAIGTVPYRMIYDTERVVVEAGKPVEFRFSNIDHMPHNLTIALPGSMEEVGLLAEETARDADAMERQYVPKTDKILVASNLLQPGQSQALVFEAPKQPGVYPIICTYPGHWRRMYGALYVTESLAEHQANPEAFFASRESQIKDDLLKLLGKGHQWKLEELIDEVRPLAHPRSFDVGKNAFKVASCVSCHQLGGEQGLQVGPDLTKLDTTKKDAEHILRSLLNPSEKIEEKFQSYVFALDSGKIVTGMILKETDKTIQLIENPLAKAKPLVIEKDAIEAQKKSPKSIMPEGLADKLTREEILDLIAYVYARGDKKHKLFGGHVHHQH